MSTTVYSYSRSYSTTPYDACIINLYSTYGVIDISLNYEDYEITDPDELFDFHQMVKRGRSLENLCYEDAVKWNYFIEMHCILPYIIDNFEEMDIERILSENQSPRDYWELNGMNRRCPEFYEALANFTNNSSDDDDANKKGKLA